MDGEEQWSWNEGELVGWSSTSLFSTNTAISEASNEGEKCVVGKGRVDPP